jgi:hypothetical protein
MLEIKRTLQHLSDENLLECYELALQMNLAEEFRESLLKEIKLRHLQHLVSLDGPRGAEG